MPHTSPILYLIRHGETEWNIEKRRQGHQDSPLTARGREQAASNGRRLRAILPEGKPLTILASPLGRAKDTALTIARELGLSPETITYESRLKECCFGAWEGLTDAEVKTRFPEEWEARSTDRWNVVPSGGESYADVHARLADWYGSTTFDQTTLIICHGLTSRVFRGLYEGLSEEEIFALPEPQDGFYALHDGEAEFIGA